MHRPAGRRRGGDPGHGRGVGRGGDLGYVPILVGRLRVGGVVFRADERRGLQGQKKLFVAHAAGDHMDGRALGAVGIDPVGVACGQADAAAGGTTLFPISSTRYT